MSIDILYCLSLADALSVDPEQGWRPWLCVCVCVCVCFVSGEGGTKGVCDIYYHKDQTLNPATGKDFMQLSKR